MLPHLHILALIACLIFGMNTSIKAAQPLNVQGTSLAEIKQHFKLILPGLVQQALIKEEDALKFLKQTKDIKKMMHIRMQQQYQGFRVFGGYVIMHSKVATSSLLTTKDEVDLEGILYKDLQRELGDPPGDFISNGRLALQQFQAKYKNGVISGAQVIPLVYIDVQNKGHWAYQVSFLIENQGRAPQRPNAIMDAQSYARFAEWDDIRYMMIPAQGQGFGGNQRVGLYQYGKDFPYLNIMRSEENEICYMENTDTKVIDMQHYTKEDTSISHVDFFPCKANETGSNVFWTGSQNDGYDFINGGYSSADDVLYASSVIKDMYAAWGGVNVLSNKDSSSMQMVMRIHYGKEYENAFWDAHEMRMSFGDGKDNFYPLTSLGISAHEVSHGFTQQHSNLAYFGESGGINESFSDMAAQAVEYYSSNTNSWQIGTEVLKENGAYQALRYMDKPSRDGRSVDTIKEFRRAALFGKMNPHFSSGIFNRLFYLMAQQPDWSTEHAFKVMVKANMDHWHPYTTFEEGACGIIRAAIDLDYPTEDIKKSMAVIGIQYTNKCAGL